MALQKKSNTRRVYWRQVAITVQTRSHQRWPRRLRVPCVETVNHDVSNRLCGLVVCRFDPGRCQEANVVVRLPAAKTVCQSSRLRARRAADDLEKPSSDPMSSMYPKVLLVNPSYTSFQSLTPDVARAAGTLGCAVSCRLSSR